RVSHASSVHELQIRGDDAIGLIAVGEQDPLVPVQQALGYRPTPRGVVVKEYDPAARRATGSHPHPMLGGGRLVAVQDLQACLVTVDERLPEHLLVEKVNEGH